MEALKKALSFLWTQMVASAKISYWVLTNDLKSLEEYQRNELTSGTIIEEDGTQRLPTIEERIELRRQADAIFKEIYYPEDDKK